MPVDI